MWLEVIVDPPGEHGRFHRRAPRLWQRFHPQVQVNARGGKRSFGENSATAVLHAVADLPLVNIQPDVIHRFHGGASLVFLNQRPLSSASSYTKRSSFDLYIQTNQELTTRTQLNRRTVSVQKRSMVAWRLA